MPSGAGLPFTSPFQVPTCEERMPVNEATLRGLAPSVRYTLYTGGGLAGPVNLIATERRASPTGSCGGVTDRILGLGPLVTSSIPRGPVAARPSRRRVTRT